MAPRLFGDSDAKASTTKTDYSNEHDKQVEQEINANARAASDNPVASCRGSPSTTGAEVAHA
jgi:hypothetical protein